MDLEEMSMDEIKTTKYPNLGRTLFLPKGKHDLLVVVVPGSDGGNPEAIASYLASKGYPALSLGYFGTGMLPSLLENIDLEFFESAMDWLENEGFHFKKKILLGYSRGGELALLLGIHYPTLFSGIVAITPPSVIVGGFPHPNIPAWLFNGEPLPFLGGYDVRKDIEEKEDLEEQVKKGTIPFSDNTSKRPFFVKALFLKRLEKGPHARLEVEKIPVPFLILSAGQDAIWPSSQFAEELKTSKNPLARFIDFEKAGHGLLAPFPGSIFHPVGKFWCSLGGERDDNLSASKKAWEEILHFIHEMKEK